MKDKKDIEKQLKQLALEYSIYWGEIIEVTIDVHRGRNSAVINCKVKGL